MDRSKLENQYRPLFELVKKKMNYAAHDFDHVLRVYNLCLFLAEDQQVNLDVLIPSALLHDIARRLEDEDSTGGTDHALVGAEMAEEILKKLNYKKDLIPKIRHCISAHRFRSGQEPQTIEARILFDADKLDVLGAVGIARSFMLAGEHGESLYRDIPIKEYLQENRGPNGRVKDASKHSSNLEFEIKLKKIPERLYTTKAKIIAQERIAYMQKFFEILDKEIKGDR